MNLKIDIKKIIFKKIAGIVKKGRRKENMRDMKTNE